MQLRSNISVEMEAPPFTVVRTYKLPESLGPRRLVSHVAYEASKFRCFTLDTAALMYINLQPSPERFVDTFYKRADNEKAMSPIRSPR
jgi:hypothetical protein